MRLRRSFSSSFELRLQVVAQSGVGAAARAFALANGVGLAFCWVGGAALDHLGRKAGAGDAGGRRAGSPQMSGCAPSLNFKIF